MANNPKKNTPVLTKKHQDRLHREQRQTRMIVIGTVVVVALAIFAVIYGYLDQKVLLFKRPVATVNGEKISVEDFRAYTKYYRYQLIQQAQQTYQFASMFGSDPSMLQQFGTQLQSINTALEPYTAAENSLNTMVDNTLVLQEAKKRGITISDEEIDLKMQEVLGYFANGTPTPTNTRPPIATSTLSPQQQSLLKPTSTQTPVVTTTVTSTVGTAQPETTLTPGATETAAATEAVDQPAETATPEGPTPTPATPTPEPTATPYTLEGYQQLYSTVVADYGTNEIPEETLRYVLTVQLYREKVQEAVIGDVPCEEEQVWAQHILVDDEATAKEIKAKLDAGADWYQMVTEFSKDTGSASNGGDVGWFPRTGQMVEEFSAAAFALKVGEISDPVQSQFGYHIIRVLGHENKPLTAVECSQMKTTKFDDWVKQTRESAKVELLPRWEENYPLQPELPAELQQVIQSLNNQQAAPAQPQIPVPTP